MPAPVRKRGRKPRSNDPLERELVQSRDDALREMRLTMSGVPYSALTIDPPLSVPEFLRVRNVAMMDRFFGDLPEPQKAEKAETSMAKLEELRGTPAYAVVRDLIEESFQRVAGVTSFADAARVTEPQAARELSYVAAAGAPRERQQAVKELADRQAPKPSRTLPALLPERSFPANVLDLMKFALDSGRQIERKRLEERRMLPAAGVVPESADLDDDTIDATYVPIPEEEPATDAREKM